MSQLSKNQLKAENQTQFPNNNVGAITPSHLRAFNVDMIDSTVNQTDFTSFSGSVASEIDALEAFSQSISTNFVSSASFSTFSQSVENQFNTIEGDIVALQNFSTSLDTNFVSETEFGAYTSSNDAKVNSLINATGSYITNAQTASMTVLSASFALTAAFAQNANFDTGSYVGTASFNAYTSSTNSRLNAIESVSGSWITESETGSFARTDAQNTFTQNNSFLQNVTISGNLYVSGSEVIVSSSTLIVGDRIIEVNANRVIGDAGIYAFDALTDQTGSMIWDPYVDFWKAGLSGSETRVITAAITSSMLAPYLTTSSFNSLTGAFATTGSNTFRGNETFEDAGGNASTLVPTSGSLMLVAKTFTSASSHISTSAGTFVNLIFKNNNNTGTTVISGSNNIFTNPSAPTAGFRREMTSDNWVNGTGAIMQLSASMAYPITNSNNIFLNPGTHQMRGPVSSSAWTYQNNIIHGNVTLGTSAAPIVNMVAGATISGNLNFGTLQFGGHPTNLLKTSVTYSRNFTLGTGAVLFSFNSGSISITNNTIVGAANTTITNNSFSGSAGTGLAASFIDNIIHGNFNTITYSGQRTTGGAPYMGGNATFGGYNELHLDTTSNKILSQAILLGNELSVSGSNVTGDVDDEFGTVIVGRYNVNDGVKNTSRENIFVVGTGNANGTKNGLLIDSGSNMFVEGTFNVSGSSNFNGNVIITGSLTASLQEGYAWVGGAGNITTTVATSSFVINTGSFVTTASFDPFSASVDSRLDNLEAATSSYITSAQTSSLSVENALTASIARNLIVIARNGGASTLPAGTVVHITSAVGDNPIFTTASYDTEALSGNTFGLLRYSSAAGADVEVVVAGVVTGVDTDPAKGYTAGDIVYLSSSGQFTKVQPQAPNQIVTLGQVLRAQQNNGSIYVSINNGWELDELHNVQITNPQTGDIIQYESASYGLWKNKSLSAAGLATTGSNTFVGTETISGSLIVTGSARGNVQALTVTSNTASIDFGAANYFTITLPTSSTTHFTATNIQPGLSAMLVITTGTGGTGASASFAPAFLQPSGSLYAPTSGSARKDVLSFLSTDTTNVFVVATKNMV